MKKGKNRELRRLPAAVISVITILALMISAAGCSGRSEKVRMGTAGIGGNYYSFGKAFAQYLMDDIGEMDVQVKVTTGSGANLRMITKEKPEIELAIMQADVIAEYNGFADRSAEPAESTKSAESKESAESTSSAESCGFGAIASMYAEAVQIVVRADAGIKSVEDLTGKTISVGEAESGTEKDALMILDAYGISSGSYTSRNLNYAKSADALEKGSIDAFFCTIGTPSTAIQSLSKKDPILLLDISGEMAETIMADHPFFVPYTIPADTYTGLEKDVQTIGVKSVLVASDSLSADMVKKITKSLFDHANDLRYAVTFNCEFDPDQAVKNLPVELHEGAKAWYQENGIQ